MKNETKNWVYFADRDIHMISNNINTDDPEATGAIAVFCQQAVEKYFKAYLIEHSVDFPKTHDLLNLYNKIKIIKNWNLDETILASLNGLYIKTRYPSDIGIMPGGNMPTLDETKEFIDFAKKIEEIFKKDLEANMNIMVKKAGAVEKNEMEAMPIWECDISEFDWHYDSEERCLLIEGEVTVSYDGGSISFGSGDYVVFPKGLSCVWKVSKPVKKHYVFR